MTRSDLIHDQVNFSLFDEEEKNIQREKASIDLKNT